MWFDFGAVCGYNPLILLTLRCLSLVRISRPSCDKCKGGSHLIGIKGQFAFEQRNGIVHGAVPEYLRTPKSNGPKGRALKWAKLSLE